jgi:hypothetical protein
MIRCRLLISGLVLGVCCTFWVFPKGSMNRMSRATASEVLRASLMPSVSEGGSSRVTKSGSFALPQAGRVGSKKGETRESTERRTAPGAPPGVDASLPVLVTMAPADFAACGLDKLSPHELERLDRWIFKLLTMASVTPSGEIIFPPPGSHPSKTDLPPGQPDASLTEMQIRLNEIRQAAVRLSNNLNYARLALGRRDVYGAESYLFSAESDVQRILHAAR